jgi:hypothetical protein
MGATTQKKNSGERHQQNQIAKVTHAAIIPERGTLAGGCMDGKAGETATGKALAMLAALESVGARAVDLTLTDSQGEKIPGGFKPNRALDE